MLTFVRLPEVKAASGKSRPTIYRDIANGMWTRPVRVGQRMVAWPKHEVEAINAARVSGKTDGEIKALVRELEALRKEAHV